MGREGLGQALSSLSGRPAARLSLPLDGGREAYGVSASGLVNIYDVLFRFGFFFFFLTVEGTVDPQQNRPPPSPRNGTPTPPPPLLPRGPFKASHIQAKARRALSRNRRACDGPCRGCPGRPAGKRTCLLRLASPPTWRHQNMRGFSPPLFCDRRGARQTSLQPSPPANPPLCFVWTCVSLQIF